MEFLLILLFSLTASLVYGAGFARRAQLVGPDNPLKPSYDFIVVGGGTSGLTVADRLTENPESEIRVLCQNRMNESIILFMRNSIGDRD